MSALGYADTSRFLATDKGRIHYHEAGQGRPLLLLHGSGPGVSGWANFEGNLPIFAERHRTFIIDFPGYGESDPVEGIPVPAGVEAVVRFLDGLGLDKVDVIGNSFGGMVAALLAAQHAGRVNRLVTIGGVGSGIFSTFPPEGISLLVEFTADPTRERLVQWLRSMVFDQSLVTDALVDDRLRRATEPKTMETSRKLYSRQAIQAIGAGMRANPAMAIAHLAQIQAPTLITWGRDDRVTPLDNALMPMRMIPNCELHVFPNCGHWAMIERKAEFENVVTAFLARG